AEDGGAERRIGDPAIPVHRRSFVASRRREAWIDAVGSGVIGEHRQCRHVADHVEDGETDAEHQGKGAETRRCFRCSAHTRTHNPKPRTLLTTWPVRNEYQQIAASTTVSHLRALSYAALRAF